MTFERALEIVLESEGRYSNDPTDPGGETKFGISKREYPEIDIPNLTREQAIEIYRRDYWDACRCSELPHGLDLAVFDSAVNQGTRTAIRILQQAAGVTTDGIVGPVTLKAVQQPWMIQEVLARRMYAYAMIPQIHRFGLGWYRRVAKVAEAAFKESA